MECIIFIGLQASGKSAFYREQFFRTHVRVNLDMLRTRHREKCLIEACLGIQQSFVVDNTNPTKEDRRKYVEAARAAGCRVYGYYFQSEIEQCKRRNESRPDDERVPLAGVLGTYGRLELPSYEEGFDELYYVRIEDDNRFVVEEWRDEV